jgi:hypothetical protein
MTPPETTAGLRAWADGLYTAEASVEFLVRYAGGRFARPGNPWIVADPHDGWCWLDPACLAGPAVAGLSSGERRVLAIVASLAGGEPVNLAEVLPGLDRQTVVLVLAAVAHAAGSHEHANIVIDHDRGVAVNHGRHPSLYPWPGGAEAVAS